MKRIFLVLALLMMAIGMAFTVTGKVFVRYDKNGPVYSAWGNDDYAALWLGKSGTGFEVNFDGFTFQYLVRKAPTAATNTLLKGFGATEDSSTPGYFRVKGINLGMVNMGVGLQWSTLMMSSGTILTQLPAVNGTNSATGAFNEFYVDYTLNVKLAEKFEIQIRDWDRLAVVASLFSAQLNQIMSGGTTNFNSGSYFWARLPIWVVFGGDNFNIEVSPRFETTSYSYLGYLQNGTANTTNVYGWNSSAAYGVWARGSLDLNDTFGIWAGAKFWMTAESRANYQNNTTSVPLFVGLIYKMAPGIKWDIGAGYNIVLANNTTEPGSTNAVSSMGFAQIDDLSDHWNNPFLSVGATGKAGEWELGLNYDVQFTPADATTTTNKNSGATYSSTYSSQILKWTPTINYDNNVYIQWSKDQIQIKGTLGTAAVANEIANIFTMLDLTVMF